MAKLNGMRQTFTLLICALCITSTLLAQQNVAINTTGAPPDSSAILDIQSTTKGLLAPRMTTEQREAIDSPAKGLLVFDIGFNSFWCYGDTSWIEIMGDFTSVMRDADGDTRIEAEMSPDEDVLRFTANGEPTMWIDSQTIHVSSNGFNTFIGWNAGMNNDGVTNYNTFIGRSAGRDNTEGHRNTFLGNLSGFETLTGHENTFLGNEAGRKNTSGDENTYVGSESGKNSTTGYQNTFVGGSSGFFTTTGHSNAFFGVNSGWECDSCEQNTGIGPGALFKNAGGKRNVALGNASSQQNITGDNNVALGYLALANNQDGDNNVAIGYRAGAGSMLGTKSGGVFIGNEAGRYEDGDNKLYIHNTDTVAPLIYGEFDNYYVRVNGGLGVGNQFITPPGQGLFVSGNTSIGSNNQYGKVSIGSVASDTFPNLHIWHSSSNGPARLHLANAGSDYWGINAEPGASGLDYFEIFNSALDENLLYAEANTNDLGIGTDDPTAQVHIMSDGATGTPQLVLQESESDDYARLQFRNGSSTNYRNWTISGKPNETLTEAYLNFYNSTAEDNLMTIRGDGRVGIGTSIDPSAQLHIVSNGSSTIPQMILYEEGATDFSRLQFQNGTDARNWTISAKTGAALTDNVLDFSTPFTDLT